MFCCSWFTCCCVELKSRRQKDRGAFIVSSILVPTTGLHCVAGHGHSDQCCPLLYVRPDQILFSLGIPRWERTPDRSTHAVTLGQRWCRRAVTSRALHRTVPSTRPAGAVSRKGARAGGKKEHRRIPVILCCPAACARGPPGPRTIFHSRLVIRYARSRLTLRKSSE